jgi:hypothetical protein
MTSLDQLKKINATLRITRSICRRLNRTPGLASWPCHARIGAAVIALNMLFAIAPLHGAELFTPVTPWTRNVTNWGH